MAYAIWQYDATDDEGNLLTDVEVEVRRQSGGLQVVYADFDGETSLGSTFVVASGKIRFHAPGGFYTVTLRKGAYERVLEYVAIGLAAASDYTLIAFQGEWNPGVTYLQGDYVIHNNVGVFVSTGDDNLNNEPDTVTPGSTANWVYFPGIVGAASYTYIGYASDDQGTDFTTTFDPELEYIAIKRSLTEIEPLLASDFAGLWTRYKGDKGWSPVYAIVADGARRVLQLTGYVGGEGTEPTANVGEYVAAGGYTATIGDAVDIRGETGAAGLDGSGSGVFVRVRVVDTAGGDPATAYEAGDTVDGIVLDENDLVLRATDGGDAADGVYVVSASGAAARDGSFSSFDQHPGCYVSVMEGAVRADTLWRCTSDKGGTIDTTALVFQEFEFVTDTSTLQRTSVLNAIRTAKAIGAAQFIPDGWVDGFGGNDGIDPLESSGYTLDTDEGTVQVGLSEPSDMVVSGSDGGTLFGFNMDQAQPLTAVFNGVTNKAFGDSCYGAGNTASGAVGVTWASPKKIAQCVAYGANNNGFITQGNPSATLQLYGKNGSAPASDTDGTLLGSTTFTDTTNESAGRVLPSSDPDTEWDHNWVRTLNNGTLTDTRPLLAQTIYTERFEGSAVDGIIQTVAKSADFVPEQIKVRSVIEAIDALVLGTDVLIEASRDGGTTFAGATPVQVHTLGAYGFVETTIDVSAQPSGSSVVSRASFLNGKQAKLAGTSESWSE